MPGRLWERSLNQDFHDALLALSGQKVDFFIVGGHAVAAHGLPRATGDIDLWIRCTPENAAPAWQALAEFGAPLGDLTVQDLETPGADPR